jgi:leader peptidase (prepilin peptidase)/N-methyltransferase
MSVGLAFAILVFILGASVGSFLNVVVYRLPYGKSLLRPPSSCPSCESRIRPWQNIPVLSWLFLRGKCANCKIPISVRYLLVELAMGLLSLALFFDLANGFITPESLVGVEMWRDLFGPFAVYLGFIGALVSITLMDLDHFIIPDEITLPGTVLGVIASFLVGHSLGITWSDSLIGVVTGAGVILSIIYLYGLLTGREGMGGGDFKLLAFIGAFLGWQALPFVILAGSLQGLLFAVVFRRSFAVEELPPDPMADEGGAVALAPATEDGSTSFRHLAVPFGPFLAMGAVEYLLFREPIQRGLTGLLEVGL